MVIGSMYIALALTGLLLAGGCGGAGDENSVAPTRADTTRTSGSYASMLQAPVAPNYPSPRPQPGEFLALVPPQREPRSIELVSVPVTNAPAIDGHASESVWEVAAAVTTLDFASQREIILKSVHTADTIFFLVTFPDDSPSETHKTWGWDVNEEIYKQMQDREDVFIFKWSLVGNDVNLAFRHAEPHRADIWFWKARRTNPSGYADDKWQELSPESHKDARKFSSSTYDKLYLRRLGDVGQRAYSEELIYEYQGAVTPRFYPRQPQGSRADVRAKGVWHDGRWTIELARKLDTGNDDDIPFAPGRVYLFAVSCYEMAAGGVEPGWSQPLYKTGDAFDRLLLRIAQEDAR